MQDKPDSNSGGVNKINSDLDQEVRHNVEGSQNPVYKITRLKSEPEEAEDELDAIKLTEQNINILSDQSKPVGSANTNGYESDHIENQGVAHRIKDIPGNVNTIQYDDTNAEGDSSHGVNKTIEMHETVEDASLNMENMIPEPPVKMTYILPKEIPIFKLGKNMDVLKYLLLVNLILLETFIP
jgi:hypothetical protein